MRDILTVTYIPKEQKDQSYTTYDNIHTIANKLKPIESGEVLWLYLTIIDDINLRIRATIWANHDEIIHWSEKYELLLWMYQKILIPGYTSDETTLVNEIWEDKETSGLDLIQTFNKACYMILAINDGLIKEIPKHDNWIFINRNDDIGMAFPGSLKNIACIFADKM